MSILDRRQLLALGGASAAVAALPFAPPPAVVAAPASVSAPPLLTWIVGTPGEWDHEIVRAATEELAMRLRCEECEFADDPDADPAEFEGGEDCLCEACISARGYEATRVKEWDGRPESSIGGGDWLAIGNEARCDRCGYETAAEEGGHNVAGKAICPDCMTLADWDIIDPEIAAELRAEADKAEPVATPPSADPSTGPGRT